jgi:hypothetical protein
MAPSAPLDLFLQTTRNPPNIGGKNTSHNNAGRIGIRCASHHLFVETQNTGQAPDRSS